MNMNITHNNIASASPDRPIRDILNRLESDTELLRQLALCLFYNELSDTKERPIDAQLWKFAIPSSSGGSIRLNGSRLDDYFFHCWNWKIWGTPFIHNGSRSAIAKYIAGDESAGRIGLTGTDFASLLAQEPWEGCFSLKNEDILELKKQIRGKLLITQRVFSQTLESPHPAMISGPKSRMNTILLA